MNEHSYTLIKLDLQKQAIFSLWTLICLTLDIEGKKVKPNCKWWK